MVSMAFLITVLLTWDQALLSFCFVRELLKLGLISWSGSASYTSDSSRNYAQMRRRALGCKGRGERSKYWYRYRFWLVSFMSITKDQCLDYLANPYNSKVDIPTPIKSFVNHKIESIYFLMLLLFPSLVLFKLYRIIYALSRSRDIANCKWANYCCRRVILWETKIQSKEGQIKKGMPLTFSEKFECVMK